MEDFEKKYKEALEKAKKAINANWYYTKDVIECVFPELKESEEEKARKELVEWLKRKLANTSIGFNHSKMENWIAYLEKLKGIDKQLEQAYKTADEVQYKRGYDKGYVEGTAFAKEQLVKQGEFPATISVDKMAEEFEDFKVMAGRIPSLAEIDAYRKGVNDVLSKVLIKKEKPITIGSKKAEGKLGEMIAASKKLAGSGEEDKQLTHKEVTKKSEQEWSEVDEVKLEEAICMIEANGNWVRSEDAVKDISNWLKSIKDRIQPQPKQEWGKEDEMSWKNAIEVAVSYFGLPSETVNWLKSIKQRLS